VPLFAITNYSHEFWPPFLAREAAMFAPFRDIMVSGVERIMKPDLAIYRLALARFGLRAEDAIFIDDKADNIAGAEAVGIRGHLFRDAPTLRADLVGLGLIAA
jgi:2-haloacid dehalogenase